MTRDPKQTQTLEEPREPSEIELGLRTTVALPIPLSRHPDFVRTRYWEKLPSDPEGSKPTAASYSSSGKTSVGVGPDDPIVQAVQAAKQQLLEAERAQQERASQERIKPERVSHERQRVAEVATASAAKTVLLPALDIVQLMASRGKQLPTGVDTVELVRRPKRKLKPILMFGAGLALLFSAASFGYLLPATSLEQARVQHPIVEPAPKSAEQLRAAVLAAAEPAAVSGSAPSPAPVLPPVSEKAAVDALFAGDYALAGRHYTALAGAHPEQPAFAEAARILTRNARTEQN